MAEKEEGGSEGGGVVPMSCAWWKRLARPLGSWRRDMRLSRDGHGSGRDKHDQRARARALKRLGLGA